MYPPIFQIVSSNQAVTTLLKKDGIVRFFQFGRAPQGVEYPYAVWQIVSGVPENCLGDVPIIDSFVVQVDVYATTEASARDVAKALRGALEKRAYITRWGGESIDDNTQMRRISFDVSFYTDRES